MLTQLEQALQSGDAEAVQDAIYALGNIRDKDGMIPDNNVFYVIGILQRPETQKSSLAAHVLNFFEFESPRLSAQAKNHCLAFLREWGDEFSDVHSMQVVAELCDGPYLKAGT
jgi:HEAT repeat protein